MIQKTSSLGLCKLKLYIILIGVSMFSLAQLNASNFVIDKKIKHVYIQKGPTLRPLHWSATSKIYTGKFLILFSYSFWASVNDNLE